MNVKRLQAIILMRRQLNRNATRNTPRFIANFSAGLRTFTVAIALGVSIIFFMLGLSLKLLEDKQDPNAEIFVLLIVGMLSIFFLLFWATGLLTELQRSDSISYRNLAHLPIPLREVFLFNYLASHDSWSCILIFVSSTSFILGLMLPYGVRMALVIVLIVLMIMSITSWTFAFRSWISCLMGNKRKRTQALMWGTLVISLITSAPLVFTMLHEPIGQKLSHAELNSVEAQFMLEEDQLLSREREETSASNEQRKMAILRYRAALKEQEAAEEKDAKLDQILVISEILIPFAWPAATSMRIASEFRGTYVRALTYAMCFIGICVLGLRRAYRIMQSEYMMPRSGGIVHRSARPTASRPIVKIRGNWLKRKIPGLSDAASAVIWGTMRRLSRMPQIKLGFLGMIILLGFIGLSSRRLWSDSEIWDFLFNEYVSFIPVIAVMASSFTFGSLRYNIFGVDGKEFGSLVLSNISRRDILLGKNLALLPLFFVTMAGILTPLYFLLEIPVMSVISAIFQFITYNFVLFMLGNYISMKMPFCTKSDNFQLPVKQIPLSMRLCILIMELPIPLLLMFFLSIPAFIEIFSRQADFFSFHWHAILSFLFAVAALTAYSKVLTHQGELLWRRERAILDVVAAKED